MLSAIRAADSCTETRARCAYRAVVSIWLWPSSHPTVVSPTPFMTPCVRSRPAGARYPAIVPAWRRAWEHVVPMFAFPPAIPKMIYTTNALESLHRSLRKIIKTRGSFPSDEAAAKLLFLAIRNAGMRWKRPVARTAAMGQFAILFEDRFPADHRTSSPRQTEQSWTLTVKTGLTT